MRRKATNLFLSVLTILAFGFVNPFTVCAQDEECDVALSYDIDADRLCVPGMALEDDIVIDGDRSDWAVDSYYNFSEHSGLTHQIQAFVTHKTTGFNQNDLYLFFEVGANDAVGTYNDEIRIGLNRGTDPDENLLVVIHPFQDGGPTTSLYKYNSMTDTWSDAGAGWPSSADIAVLEDTVNEYWSVEIRLPLHSAPIPITGNDFRLYLESHVDDASTVVVYPWPPHYVVGEHNYICVNPERWHPMSFGDECFPDIHIANGLYSCDAIYVMRDGAKSREIGVNEMNEFHVDVSNGHMSKSAEDVHVYMTLLQLGTSTAPIAMNYSHTDTDIVNWFEEQWGSWQLATDSLDSGTPRQPEDFTVNAGSMNTDARFDWRPSDETRFGDPSDMVGSHKCTAAFVAYKDDPNMANNFSYCNTQIVECPEGQLCYLGFWTGNYYAYNHNEEAFTEGQLLRIKALNTPYSGWFNNAKIKLAGESVERINSNVFQIPVPVKGNSKVELGIAVPPQKEKDLKNWLRTIGYFFGFSKEAYAARLKTDTIIAQQKERLSATFGDYPIVIIESLVSAGYKYDRKQEIVQLYRPTNYVAFVIKSYSEDGPVICGCGKSSKQNLAFAPFIVIFGLTALYRMIGRKRR